MLKTPEDQLNGTEKRIKKKYLQNDLSWFPLKRTLNILEKNDEEVELKERLELFEKKLEVLERAKKFGLAASSLGNPGESAPIAPNIG